MSLIGNIGPYEDSEKISTYIDRVKLYFEANNISQAKQVPAFLSIMGPKLHGLVKDLVSPKNSKDCSFDVLVNPLIPGILPEGLNIKVLSPPGVLPEGMKLSRAGFE